MYRDKSFHDILDEMIQKKQSQNRDFPPIKTAVPNFKSQIPLYDLLIDRLEIPSESPLRQYNAVKEQFPFFMKEPNSTVTEPEIPELFEPEIAQVLVSELSSVGQLALEQLISRGADDLRSKTLSEPQLKKAFRLLARSLHPDLKGDDPRWAADFHAMHEEYLMVLSAFNDQLN